MSEKLQDVNLQQTNRRIELNRPKDKMSNRLLDEAGSAPHSLRPAAEEDEDKGTAVQFRPEEPAEPEGCGEIVKAWPKTTLLIIGNEFCERFSYYGMRTILTIYMLSILKWDPNMTTSVFHMFIFLAYFTPILGSILADGYIGKFHTILWLSIIYAGGQVTLTVASTFKSGTPFFHPWLDIIGLLVIGLGTGGIKPCVSSFGGDQFEPSQLKLISMFFSAFYFAINAGSCISTVLTPILRSVACLDNDSCFPLAFGLPAALMIVATVIFVAGSYWYKKKPPKENVIFLVIGTTFKGLWNRIRSGGVKRNHWVEHYLNTHSCASDPACLQLRNSKKKKNKCHKAEFIEGLKGVYHVMVMFIPVPIFWALFDQTGSRWIIQAVAMNGRLWKGGLNIAPDQLQVANALLILVMIPLFQLVIYPLVKKFGIEPTPLRRMSVGGFIAAFSFVVVGFIQLQVNHTLPIVPEHGHIHLIGINVMPECDVSVGTEKGDNFLFSFSDDKKHGLKTSPYVDLDIVNPTSTLKLDLAFNGTGCPTTENQTIETKFEERQTYYFLVGTNKQSIIGQIQQSKLTKSRGGNGESTVNVNSFINVTDEFKGLRIAFCRFDEDYKRSHVCNPRQGDEFAYATFCLKPDVIKDVKNEQDECKERGLSTTFADLREGKYKVYSIKYGAPEKEDGSERTISAAAFDVYIDKENPIGSIDVEGQGAIVTHTFYNDTSGHAVDYTATPNSMSILWQLIPYAIITSSEILFSITGLEFSYSQAPRNMKAFMSAMWLLTVAMGNVIVFVVTEIEIFENLAWEMFFYAALMAAVMLLFTAMSVFYYEYHYYTESDDEDEVGDGAADNPAMVDEDEVIESKY